MLAARGPLLSRAIAQIARNNGKLLGVAKNTMQLQLTIPVRHSGHWTYRTGITSNPLGKRIVVQLAGGCKSNPHSQLTYFRYFLC